MELLLDWPIFEMNKNSFAFFFPKKLENTTYCINILTLNIYFTPIQQ